VRQRLESRFLEMHLSLRQDTARVAVEAILPLLNVIRTSAAPAVRPAGEGVSI